jgi:hypothetical protein
MVLNPTPDGAGRRRHPRRAAVALLIAGGALALGTPIYLSYAAPYRASLVHPVILAGQVVPYLVCAGIWLPWRASAAATTALILAALLLLTALLLYSPMLWSPEAQGGDMLGLAFILISMVTTAAVLVGSAVALLVLCRRRRGRRPPPADLPDTHSPSG